jgi:hypothetical protein
MRKAAPTVSPKRKNMIFSTSYLLFSDVKGHSDLTDSQLIAFCTGVVPKICQILNERHPFYINSWGDAFVAAFEDAFNAADSALELRDWFSSQYWKSIGFPEAFFDPNLTALWPDS